MMTFTRETANEAIREYNEASQAYLNDKWKNTDRIDAVKHVMVCIFCNECNDVRGIIPPVDTAKIEQITSNLERPEYIEVIKSLGNLPYIQ